MYMKFIKKIMNMYIVHETVLYLYILCSTKVVCTFRQIQFEDKLQLCNYLFYQFFV